MKMKDRGGYDYGGEKSTTRGGSIHCRDNDFPVPASVFVEGGGGIFSAIGDDVVDVETIGLSFCDPR